MAVKIPSQKELQELLTRSIATILPTATQFEEVLKSGRRLRMYIGADATGPQLHLGHATNFLFLEKLRKLGHEVIILFGDFTAMIGDPTDRESARVPLSEEQVNVHIATWKDQVGRILDFDATDNPALIKRNSQWLSKLNFGDILSLASNFTVQQMLERDMFEKRINEGKPVHLHEFLYPLMQGYDSVAMDVDVEVGGTDQTFNMLAGRMLQKKLNNREKFVVATTLLENPKTRKKLMSKSQGGYIALNDPPTEMYAKTMALPDEVIRQMFVDCTTISLEDMEPILNEENPRDAKMRLAREIVTLYHAADAAQKAEDAFISTFQKGAVPDEVDEVARAGGETYADALVRAGTVSSKAELSRLFSAGAVSDAVTGEKYEKIPDASGATLKIGKRRFVKLG